MMKVVRKLTQFLLLCAILAGCILGYAYWIEPNLMLTSTHALQTDTKTDGFKVVFFSDTHLGKFYDQSKLERIVEKINQQDADFVIFGGDFFDGYYRDKELLDLDYIGGQLAKITAKHGKLAIWGNHDYGGGSARVYPALMERGGFTLLKNETLDFADLNVAITGLDDFSFGNPRLPKNGLPADRYNLIATHAPDAADRIDSEQVALVVAGHSHGGQINLPFLTRYALPSGAETYVKGLYPYREGSLLVSRGLGMTALPLRFGSVPELHVIEITPID